MKLKVEDFDLEFFLIKMVGSHSKHLRNRQIILFAYQAYPHPTPPPPPAPAPAPGGHIEVEVLKRETNDLVLKFLI